MVAKSYQKLPIVSDPFKKDGKMYIEVEKKDGSRKVVRFYTEQEYAKMYKESIPVEGIKRRKTQKEILGFKNGYITIFKGDTYKHKDWLHDIGCTYQRMWGWSFSSEKELPIIIQDLTPIRLEWDFVGNDDGFLKPEEEVVSRVSTLIYDPTCSNWQGAINQRLDLNIKVIKNIKIESDYGPSVCHTFEDKNGNHYVWFTSAKDWEVGKELHIRGTVKEHKMYQNDKQTILTRCALVK